MSRTVPCPHCGEDIRVEASSCKHCGSDEHTGWQQESSWVEGRPDELGEEDYADFLAREFGASRRPRLNRKTAAVALAVLLLVLVLVLGPAL